MPIPCTELLGRAKVSINLTSVKETVVRHEKFSRAGGAGLSRNKQKINAKLAKVNFVLAFILQSVIQEIIVRN